jgi:hypothetical protein
MDRRLLVHISFIPMRCAGKAERRAGIVSRLGKSE